MYLLAQHGAIVFIPFMRSLACGEKAAFHSSSVWKWPDWYHVAFNCFINSRLNSFIVFFWSDRAERLILEPACVCAALSHRRARHPLRMASIDSRSHYVRRTPSQWPSKNQPPENRELPLMFREIGEHRTRIGSSHDEYHSIWSIWIWWTFNYCSLQPFWLDARAQSARARRKTGERTGTAK